MDKVKLAFFGTSDRTIQILSSINESEKFELVLCVTKEDVKIGREQNTKETEVKKWAIENNIDYFCISNIHEQKDDIVDLLKNKGVKIGLVADFSFIIPQEIIDAVQFGLINIHFSLLPKYRGASPVQFSILKGDTQVGITYQKVHFNLDKGDILYQFKYDLVGNETAGEVYDTLFKIAANEIVDVLSDYLNGGVIPTKQDESEATYTYSPSHIGKTTIFKEDAKINWELPDDRIYNAIRAYNPWPIAWTTLGEFELGYLTRFDAAKSENNINQYQKIRLKKHVNRDLILKIYEAALAKKLFIDKLQVEGKSPTDWNSFANGYLEKVL